MLCSTDDSTFVRAVTATGRRTLAISDVTSEISILHSVWGAPRLDNEVKVSVGCRGLGKRSDDTAFKHMQSAGAPLSKLSSFFTTYVPDLKHTVVRRYSPPWDDTGAGAG